MAARRPRPRGPGGARSAQDRSGGALPAVDRRDLLARLNGDAALASDLLRLFVDESEPLVARIREALARGDLPAVAREAHSLKGAAAYVSAVASRLIAGTLEAAARRDQADAVRELIEPLEQALRRVRALLG